MKHFTTTPEWFRIADAAVYSRLSTTELFRICITGDVESIHKIQPGRKRGIRLIRKKSLDEYLESFLPGGSRYMQTPAMAKAA
jgi:hypothetical protein